MINNLEKHSKSTKNYKFVINETLQLNILKELSILKILVFNHFNLAAIEQNQGIKHLSELFFNVFNGRH